METVALTISEAVTVLDPPMTERQLRDIINALHLQPCGRHHTGRRGQPVKTYSAAEIFRLHQAVTPWLTSQRDNQPITV